MAIIVKIKFLAGYLEGLEYQYLKKDKLSPYNKTFGAPKVYISDIISAEVATEESLKTAGGTLGGALLGGALFGGVGALAGALTGGNKNMSTLVIEWKDGSKSLAQADSEVMSAIRTHLFKHYEKKITSAKKSGSIWKKVIIGFFVLVFLNAIATRKNKEKEPVIEPTTKTETPCKNIKTMEDWNKASKLWQITNAECLPK